MGPEGLVAEARALVYLQNHMPPSMQKAVLSAGFGDLSVLAHISPEELAEATGHKVDAAHCAGLIAATRAAGQLAPVQPAADTEPPPGAVMSLCRSIDDPLGGGARPGELLEVCAEPGAGKTQLLLQFALDCVVPKECSGPGGSAVYIDTEGGAVTERAREMAAHLVRQLAKVAEREPSLTPAARARLRELTCENVLARLHYYRATDAAELLALLHVLPELLRQGTGLRNVKLIAIDSIAFPFRFCSGDALQLLRGPRRSAVFAAVAQRLRNIAQGCGVAVVVANQVTTRFAPDGLPEMVPAMGLSWGHEVSTRLRLRVLPTGERQAALDKGGDPRWCGERRGLPYKVSERGVRDAPSDRRRRPEPEEGPAKHQRCA
eukprot:TRINITY_DN60516_c0_g1_i1.p1 TRINITY_DN60516_c0_g1~~TRINITY_DN60516_c0_g1_i1.p1  ORF type:complete len:405 (+),score=139.09 TRINITY_DN60516_c0_g1_i1:86-1216(+)